MDNRSVFQAWLRKHLGFDADPEKISTLLDLLGRPAGWPHATYSDAIYFWQQKYEDEKICQQLVKQLVNNESYFFREPFCYCFFNSEMIKHCAGSAVPFSVLSLGCSAGQELYSCAIQAHKNFGEKFDEKVNLIGADIDESILEKARKGIFSDWDMRGLSPAELKSHFRYHDGQSTLSKSIRDRVTFVRQNIFAPWSSGLPSKFDFVFCRNLLVHFAPPARRDCLRKLKELVRPGGALVLAAAEIASLDVEGFVQMEHEGYFYLKRATGAQMIDNNASVAMESSKSSFPARALIGSKKDFSRPSSPRQSPEQSFSGKETESSSTMERVSPVQGVKESASAYRKALAEMKEKVSSAALVSSAEKIKRATAVVASRTKSNDRDQVFERNLHSCFEKYSNGEIQEALQYCELCLKQSSAVSPEAEGSFLVIKGLSHKALGNTKGALSAFERSAFLLPLSWTANFFLGEMLMSTERNSEAAKAFVRAFKCLTCDNVPLIDVLFLEDLPRENMKSVCFSRLESLDSSHLVEEHLS